MTTELRNQTKLSQCIMKSNENKINSIIFILIIICIINCSYDTTEPKSTGQTGEIRAKSRVTYDKYEDGYVWSYSGNVSK